jgi:hypothetical protein
MGEKNNRLSSREPSEFPLDKLWRHRLPFRLPTTHGKSWLFVDSPERAAGVYRSHSSFIKVNGVRRAPPFR